MKSTVINSSKEMSAYSDYPPPADFANFMHNTKLLEYLRLYAEHNNLHKYIQFHTKVIEVRRADDYAQSAKWIVHVKNTCVCIDVLHVIIVQ
jgi:dimethylaniline monooxygenase (N-oxide forming)